LPDGIDYLGRIHGIYWRYSAMKIGKDMKKTISSVERKPAGA
jgi:hypothetical protein